MFFIKWVMLFIGKVWKFLMSIPKALTCHFQVKLIAFIMYLFCIFILLIGNTGNSECNYKNENRFELVFRKSEKYVLGLRKTADVDIFSEQLLWMCLASEAQFCFDIRPEWNSATCFFIHVEHDTCLEQWQPLLEFAPKIWQFAVYLYFTFRTALPSKNERLHYAASVCYPVCFDMGMPVLMCENQHLNTDKLLAP